jgi:hypothetical protein
MTIEEKIKGSIARHPEWDDRRVSRNAHGSTLAMVAAVRAGEPIPEPEKADAVPAAHLRPNVTLISVEDIKRKYDMFGAIMDIIRSLAVGDVIDEPNLKASVDHPDPFRFKRTIEAHEKELEPYRIMLKYKGSEPKYHYARPDVIADIRRTLEKP